MIEVEDFCAAAAAAASDCLSPGIDDSNVLKGSFPVTAAAFKEGFRSGSDLPIGGDFVDWMFWFDGERGCSGDGIDGLAVVGGAILNRRLFNRQTDGVKEWSMLSPLTLVEYSCTYDNNLAFKKSHLFLNENSWYSPSEVSLSLVLCVHYTFKFLFVPCCRYILSFR